MMIMRKISAWLRRIGVLANISKQTKKRMNNLKYGFVALLFVTFTHNNTLTGRRK